ncbi:GNAT family N-acetyltransferase [Planococcus sp. CAU13]|uniref:GNAT family N-acetyltransferase n=1 Tax=Planococcus sp. CAU13 TaxID=1541197 RepID=UPI0005300A52|nr:GNAT family protein [Planococcus sp. CAU13]
MEITLDLLQDEEAEDLFRFEIENRAFFEQWVPSRGDSYYTRETFLKRHRELLAEQASGVCRFYLIKDPEGNIAGRINLVDIDAASGTAEIGFRMGEAYGGKGIGSRALSLLLSTDSTVDKIYAKTTTVNKSSQKVLERNEFIHMGISDDEFEMNGEKMKFVNYEWDRKK